MAVSTYITRKARQLRHCLNSNGTSLSPTLPCGGLPCAVMYRHISLITRERLQKHETRTLTELCDENRQRPLIAASPLQRTSSSSAVFPEVPGAEVTAALGTAARAAPAAAAATTAVHCHGSEPLRALLLVLAEHLRMHEHHEKRNYIANNGFLCSADTESGRKNEVSNKKLVLLQLADERLSETSAPKTVPLFVPPPARRSSSPEVARGAGAPTNTF